MLKGSATRFGGIPARWRRWVALGMIALLAVFLVWYFVLRDTEGQGPGGTTALPRPALGKTIPLEDYRIAVNDALVQVREAQSLSGDERKKAVESAISTLEKVEGARVVPQDGSGDAGAAEVDNTNLLAELREDDPDLSQVESGLAALEETLHEPSGSVGGTLDGEDAKQELQSVLADPAFDYERDLSPLQRLARWISSLTGQADPGGN